MALCENVDWNTLKSETAICGSKIVGYGQDRIECMSEEQVWRKLEI